jgi:hypothetical protein
VVSKRQKELAKRIIEKSRQRWKDMPYQTRQETWERAMSIQSIRKMVYLLGIKE